MLNNTSLAEDVAGYRLSPQQEHLWKLQSVTQDNSYIAQCAVCIDGKFDVEILKKSLQNVVNQHEILRTSFRCLPGMTIPLQVIADSQDISINYYDISDFPAEEKDKNIELFLTQYKTDNLNFEQIVLQIDLIKVLPKQYILLVSVPAMISDGIGLRNLVHEINRFYAATINKEQLSDEVLQYADIAEWQHELLTAEEANLGKAYWQQQELPSSFGVQLPFEQQVSEDIAVFQSQEYRLKIDKNLLADIEKIFISQKETNYLAEFLLTCWQIVLGRNLGNPEIVVGKLYDGRKYEELQGAIGLFAKYLPIASRLQPDLSFKETWQQVQELVSQGYQWQDYFSWQEYSKNLSISFLPFCFEFTEQAQQESANTVTFNFYKEYVNIDRFKLKLSCLCQKGDLAVDLYYDASLFKAEDIERLALQFQQLLFSVTRNPNAAISDLEILSDHELEKLLFEFNNTQINYDRSQLIHQLFEAQAERTPDNIAVVFNNQQLTYRELNERANKLANYLQKLGVKPEVLVGICVERSLSMAIGILAILKAGGAYLPLDPTYPSERQQFILKDTQTPVLLTQQSLLKNLPENTAKIICLDIDWETFVSESHGNPTVAMTSANLAYIIYTSGSTGKPKGVQITHQNLVNSTQARLNYYQEPVSSFLLLSSFAFDSSVAGIFWTLCSGGTLVFPQAEVEQDIPQLLNLITQNQVTHLLSLPSLYKVILEQATKQELVSLQSAIVAGEPCPPELVARHLEQLPHTSLFNEYGPTEATVWSSVYHCCSPEIAASVSIGRPIANAQIYLLDPNLHPVPLGVAGEVYIGGDGLARGYLNHPDLTAERFIPNPFSNNQTGLRLYKTGDLARYLPDGNIEFLGRIDQQVKIRGFRIELGEIEVALAQHPNIRANVVVAREEKSGQKRLVAYIVPQPGQVAPTLSDLRHFLEEKLPDYMVPSTFVRISTIPRLPNGKIDLKALPDPELSGTFVAPRTAVEKILADIWAQVLRLEKVGIQDNFFELGGDSILSIQIVAKANQAGFQLTPKQVFDRPTIAKLAEVVSINESISAEQGLITGEVPLTPIQHWFFAQNRPDVYHWNQSLLLEIQQGHNLSLWEHVVQHLVEHHDVLRLRFHCQASAWEQIISASEATAIFTRIDLSALQELEQKTAIEKTATELQASLNLSDGPVVKFALFELGAQTSSRLLIIIHHLAVDGISWRILLEDLQTAYQQLNQDEAIHLPNKTTSFQEWACRLQEYAQSPTLKQELNYWLTQLEKPISTLPVDYAGGKNTVAEARTIAVSLSQQETQALLQDVHQAYHTQINDVLLTALVQAFAEQMGENSLLLELEGHGREDIFSDVNLSRTVGWFTTHFPVLLNLGTVKDLGNALKVVKEQLRSIPNRGLGYGVLRYLSDEGEKLQGLPQAEVLFNYLGQTDQVMSQSSLFAPAKESTGSARSLRGSRVYLLEVVAIVTGSQLQVNWTYSEAIHQRATVEKLANSFIKALRSLITHCQSPEAIGFTPSDFPQAKLNQQDLDKFLAKINQQA
ncbi:amino acid adenylation domain-containing protein [Nostoc sp. UCD121]|nr:amino acid adenylation domain-containing protein [Nostoc sp. UCD121]MBC1293582.1 amino acid adenylation domain-containing protein [Nostoc sp. UCD122]